MQAQSPWKHRGERVERAPAAASNPGGTTTLVWPERLVKKKFPLELSAM